MVATAWDLGSARPPRRSSAPTWAHTLGYGGHPLAECHRYFVTFGQAAGRTRRPTAARQRHPGGERDPWGRPLDETTVLILVYVDLRRDRL